MDLEAGKQTAALLRLALSSGGLATIVISDSVELQGILNVLAFTEGMDWSKIMIIPMAEYFGISRNTKGSLQFELNRRIISVKSGCSASGMINGEGIPSSELKRLNSLLETRKPDILLTSIGPLGEIGMIESGRAAEIQGYQITEPSEIYRKQQVELNQFKSIHDVPRRGIQLSLGSLLKIKHIVCCLSGKAKSDIAYKLTQGKDLPEICKGLVSHSDLHLHLEADAASKVPHQTESF